MATDTALDSIIPAVGEANFDGLIAKYGEVNIKPWDVLPIPVISRISFTRDNWVGKHKPKKKPLVVIMVDKNK